MLKRNVVLVFLLVVIILVFLGYASSQADRRVIPNSHINKSNINSLDKNQKYRVIVKMNENSKFNTKEVKENRFQYGNLAALELNKSEIEKIMDSSDVVLEREFHTALTSSISIINATRVLPIIANGKNLTGWNQTICIIDTGVDYNHTDLGGCYGNNDASSTCKVIGGYDFVNGDSNPMDDHGHGTHVAGIAAANGSIMGVAPEAKIIAMKALNSAGSGTDTNIIKGIEWCVGNASLYNIVAISMSFGDELNYTSYCNSDTLAASISAAVGKNISVVVAAGNSGNFTALSSPACVQNVTSVGATNKDDSIASYSDRSSFLSLLAPGTSISSTCLGGGSCINSGTSMSTPHVAGAIAIIKEFLAQSGKSLNPKEIEVILNSSGKFIYDSSSVRNYSRLNVYDTVSSVSYTYINLVSPADALSVTVNQSFVCNVSSVYLLNNVTFYLWNASSLKYNQTTIISNLINSSTFAYNFTHEGSYYWNCLFTNNLTLSSFASNNFSISYDITKPNITVISPVNNSWINAGRFNVSLNENGACRYSLNDGGVNATMNSSDNRNFSAVNSTLLQDNSYNVTYYCNDTTGNTNNSIVFFRIDLTKPNVSILSPADGASANAGSVSFQYNVSDNLNVTQCALILNGASAAINASAIGNSTNNITYTMSAGSHSWNINCTDEAGNVGNSTNRSLTVNAVESTSSSGGGGGGGGSSGGGGKTYTVDSVALSGGYTQEVGIGEIIKFNLTDFETSGHTLSLDNVESRYVNVTLRSSPIKVSINIGEEKKFNLTSDYYDLSLKVESINGKKATLTVRSIREITSNEKIEPGSKTYHILDNSAPISEHKDNTMLLKGLSAIHFIMTMILLINRASRIKKVNKIKKIKKRN